MKEFQESLAVGCLAYVLRKFEEVLICTPSSPAKEVIELIRSLYEVERRVKENALDAKGIQERHKSKSQPILEKIYEWSKDYASKILPNGHFGKAINYTINNWQALTTCTKNDRLSIGNDFSESDIKLTKKGKKKFLSIKGVGRKYSNLTTDDLLANIQRIFRSSDCQSLTPFDIKHHYVIRDFQKYEHNQPKPGIIENSRYYLLERILTNLVFIFRNLPNISKGKL